MKSDLGKIIVSEKTTLREIVRRMNQSNLKIVIVCAAGRKLKGVMTHGDVRRAVHRGLTLDMPIASIYNREPQVAEKGASIGKIKRAIYAKSKTVGGTIRVPIINKKGKVVDLATVNRNQINFLSKINLQKTKSVEKVLVTGGAGYLGSVLVRKLLAAGYKVKVLDNLTHGKDSLTGIWAHRNFDLVVGDILRIDDVVGAIADVDAVVHLAAIVGDEASNFDPIKTINNNLLATINIANACKKFLINRFIFTSSCSIYGASAANRLLWENSLLTPASLYAYSKLESEIELARITDEDFAPTILRLATLFGKSFRPRFDLVVNQMSAQAFFRREVVVFGGNQWRPFLHTADAAAAIIKVLESPISTVAGETFNVGSENIKIGDLAEKVKSILPDIQIKKETESGDARNYRVSFVKIKKRLGFLAKMTIEDGIEEIIGDLKRKNYNNLSRLTNSPTANFALFE